MYRVFQKQTCLHVNDIFRPCIRKYNIVANVFKTQTEIAIQYNIPVKRYTVNFTFFTRCIDKVMPFDVQNQACNIITYM